MKVLAIGAHPDDIEIFMYGTLALFKKQGHHIFLGIATDGAAGKLQNSKNLKEIRKKEAISGLKNLVETSKYLFFLNCSKNIYSDNILP